MGTETFHIDRKGMLVRSVVPTRGEPYEHRCRPETYEALAHAIDEAADRGCTIEELAASEGVPMTQVAVAIAFLKERGCISVEGRRSYPATGSVHLDAMVEFHALREAPGG